MTAKKKKTSKKKITKQKAKKPKPRTAQTQPDRIAEKPVDPDLKVTPHPTSSRVVNFEEKLDGQISDGPPESEKRGRGRPLGSTKESAEETPVMVAMDKQVIIDFIKIPFDMWATSQRLKGLQLTDKELENLAAPTITLLNYYVPEVPAIAFAWASLAITAYSVTSPRIALIEIAREQRKIKNEALRNANQSRPTSNQPRGPVEQPNSSTADKFPRPDEMTPLEIKH